MSAKEKKELLQALNYLRALEDNWNIANIQKPTGLSIHIAENFIKNIPSDKELPTEILSDGEGGIILKWHNDNYKTSINFRWQIIYVSIQYHEEEIKFIEAKIYNDESTLVKEMLPHVPTKL
jgi:hypothetical protein